MGYLDPDGFYIYEESDAADPGAGFSDLLNKSTRAMPAAVDGRVVAGLAAAPTVEAAAAAAVDGKLEEADVLTGDEHRSPKEGNPENFQIGDRFGMVSFEVRPDGTTYIAISAFAM